MRKYNIILSAILSVLLYIPSFSGAENKAVETAVAVPATKTLTLSKSKELAGKSILIAVRKQHKIDHHNTANMYQKGEINQASWNIVAGNSRLVRLDYDADGNPSQTILLESTNGVIRDLCVSFDAKKAVFSMRKNFDDSYNVYEINLVDGKYRQITSETEASDIDPIYLPEGRILFASTRAAKYCGCNRHIMCNLYSVDSDGGALRQIGNSIEFENTPHLMRDGRILYTRWEYVDRNFSGAQGLWTCNIDGTRHALYWGQETKNPALQGKQIPDSSHIVAILGSCHDINWGALAIIDRNIDVEGEKSVVKIFPESSRSFIDKKGDKNADSFKKSPVKYQYPEPIDSDSVLVSRTEPKKYSDARLYIVKITDGSEKEIAKSGDGVSGIFDATLIMPKDVPQVPENQFDSLGGKSLVYVSDVYEGTHMKGIKKGEIKKLRVIENPPKLFYSKGGWEGEGQQAPAMNFDDYDDKVLLGTVPVEEDGSAYFEVPPNKFIYLQALDKDGNMLQSMRSGMVVLPNEIASCTGCHESRMSAPSLSLKPSSALRRSPSKINPEPMGACGKEFDYMQMVQPVFDKYCLSCHDFGGKGSGKVVLAPDRGIVFNQSYLQLHCKKIINAIGAGPDRVQEANTWGAKHSLLMKNLTKEHVGKELSANDIDILRVWIDLNAPYYPNEDSNYGDNPAGRSPLTIDEVKEIYSLAGRKLALMPWSKDIINGRKYGLELLSFERPEKSPILDGIDKNSKAYARIVELVKIGGERLKAIPREDMPNCKTTKNAECKIQRLKRFLKDIESD